MARHLPIDQPLDLKLSLTMGQAFRWRSLGDGWLPGVLGPNLFHVRQTGGGMEYEVASLPGHADDPDQLLRRYFRLDDGVAAIYDDISNRDSVVADLVRKYPGMRVLRQEPWECMVAYICSANNNIPQISRVVEKIADSFGAEIELDGETRRTFPSPQRILADPDSVETLTLMKLGLKRAPNIVAAAVKVTESELDLDDLAGKPYDVVKAELMQCRGIGNKIADCISLFSLDKLDAFPVDLHIGRSLVERYDCPLSQNSGKLSEGTYKKTVRWSQEHFGQYCGWAGQYLFHGIEPNK